MPDCPQKFPESSGEGVYARLGVNVPAKVPLKVLAQVQGRVLGECPEACVRETCPGDRKNACEAPGRVCGQDWPEARGGGGDAVRIFFYIFPAFFWQVP